MEYCKNYCEEKGISTSKLNEAQRTLYYIAENMKMAKSINEEGYKHFQMAIKALEKHTEERTKTHECDCISRQAALKYSRIEYDDDGEGHRVIYAEDIEALPPITPQPERKLGHWEWDQRAGEYVCSECSCNPIYERTTPDCSEIDKYRFCRWCGADMREVEKE